MPFVYEVHANGPDEPYKHYYGSEGHAIQAARRSAESQVEARPGLYAITGYRVSLWTDETMVLTDSDGHSLVHVHRHPVL